MWTYVILIWGGLFGEIHRNIAKMTDKMTSEQSKTLKLFRSGTTCCEHMRPLSPSDWETDAKELMGGGNFFRLKMQNGQTVRRDVKGWTKQEMKEDQLVRTLQSRCR